MADLLADIVSFIERTIDRTSTKGTGRAPRFVFYTQPSKPGATNAKGEEPPEADKKVVSKDVALANTKFSISDIRDMIDSEERRFGIPDGMLFATIEKESSGDPYAKAETTSARGLMQVTDAALQDISDEAGQADRFSIKENISTGAAYLGKCRTRIMSKIPSPQKLTLAQQTVVWAAVTAAYNRGITFVAKVIENHIKAGKPFPDTVDMLNTLIPPETAQYVNEIQAKQAKYKGNQKAKMALAQTISARALAARDIA